jgi:hypothetical protein
VSVALEAIPTATPATTGGRYDLTALPVGTIVDFTSAHVHGFKLRVAKNSSAYYSKSTFWGLELVASTDLRFRLGRMSGHRHIAEGHLFFIDGIMVRAGGLTVVTP